MNDTLSGAYALARGAIAAGVSLVTSYAGGPATAVVNGILQMTRAGDVRVEWTSNEKIAAEMALGGSLAGLRSLLCVKSVGLNIALDPLMTFNLSGCNAGLVLLVGDDPGAWGSQNEQDSRLLALAAELPLLEPASVADAYLAMVQAFRLSEQTGLPVIVRVTRALVLARESVSSLEIPYDLQGRAPPGFQREFMRWVVLPINTIQYHRRLHERLADVQARFEGSTLNHVQGEGAFGVIAAGFAYQKLIELLGGILPAGLRLLCLATVHPLPAGQITAFLRQVRAALVLEETAPLVERAVKSLAQESGLLLPVYGRGTGHVPGVGELFAPHIAAALNELQPHLGLPLRGETSRPLPSREALCEGCPYIPTFDALTQVMDQEGGRDHYIVVGDPGCIARSQLPPYELLDVKISLGSSISIAAGIAIGVASTQGPAARHIVALCGDSSFLHSGFSGLVDAVRVGVPMLVVILDNGTTALSGGQPHAASPLDARGRSRQAVDLAALVRGTGASQVEVVDLDRGEDIRPAIEAGLDSERVSVVISRGQCPRYPLPAHTP